MAVAAYFINSYIDKKAKEKAEKEERQKIENAVNKSVNEMITKFDAAIWFFNGNIEKIFNYGFCNF